MGFTAVVVQNVFRRVSNMGCVRCDHKLWLGSSSGAVKNMACCLLPFEHIQYLAVGQKEYPKTLLVKGKMNQNCGPQQFSFLTHSHLKNTSQPFLPMQKSQNLNDFTENQHKQNFPSTLTNYKRLQTASNRSGSRSGSPFLFQDESPKSHKLD